MLTIKVQSDTISVALARLGGNLSDLTPLMKNLAGILEASVADNFQHQGLPAWDALSPVTVAARAKRGNWPGKILQASGKLANSITSAYDATSAHVGTNDIRAKTLQFGAASSGKGARKMPWGNIPARPFLALNHDAMTDIEHAILAFAGGAQKS